MNGNFRKSKSNETLASLAKKITGNSFVRKSRSEFNIVRPKIQEQYIEVLKKFFSNYPKNLFNNSINCLKVVLFKL